MYNVSSLESFVVNGMEILDCIKKLTPKEQAVIAMTSSGYTHYECGLVIGMTKAAVGFIRKRALLKIKRFMGVANV